MSASDIAKRHFQAALREAEDSGLGNDGVSRNLLWFVVSKYLESRSIAESRRSCAMWPTIARPIAPDTDPASAHS